MTEERIERFSDHAWNIWEKAWTAWDEASSKADPECNTKAVIIISENLSAVAAEARKEGIEELQAALINKLTDDSWRLKKLIETQAERLKEGG